MIPVLQLCAAAVGALNMRIPPAAAAWVCVSCSAMSALWTCARRPRAAALEAAVPGAGHGGGPQWRAAHHCVQWPPDTHPQVRWSAGLAHRSARSCVCVLCMACGYYVCSWGKGCAYACVMSQELRVASHDSFFSGCLFLDACAVRAAAALAWRGMCSCACVDTGFRTGGRSRSKRRSPSPPSRSPRTPPSCSRRCRCALQECSLSADMAAFKQR